MDGIVEGVAQFFVDCRVVVVVQRFHSSRLIHWAFLAVGLALATMLLGKHGHGLQLKLIGGTLSRGISGRAVRRVGKICVSLMRVRREPLLSRFSSI